MADGNSRACDGKTRRRSIVKSTRVAVPLSFGSSATTKQVGEQNVIPNLSKKNIIREGHNVTNSSV